MRGLAIMIITHLCVCIQEMCFDLTIVFKSFHKTDGRTSPCHGVTGGRADNGDLIFYLAVYFDIQSVVFILPISLNLHVGGINQ